MRIQKSFAVFLMIVQSIAAFAADAPLGVSYEFDLTDGSHEGTFFNLMSRKKTGIKARLDADYDKSVEVVDPETFLERSSHFAHIEKLAEKIQGGMDGISTVISKLQGKKIAVSGMYAAVMRALKSNDLFISEDARQRSRLAGALVPVIAIASGKGVLVRLDGENYCYNYGYAKGSGGSDLEADKINRKSGRSYGASVERNAYDPTDADYLKALGTYVANAGEMELRNFYYVIFQILLKSDTSGLRTLTNEGQLLIADFMAVYMAELDRHLMTGLKRYEWENALTEITMLAAYAANAGGVTLDPRGGASNEENKRELVKSSVLKADQRMLGFFGVGTDGSGLDGKNKTRRHKLTRAIVEEMREVDAELVTEIETLIGSKAGVDIYDEVMNRINSPRSQELLTKNADRLIDALVEFVMLTGESAAEMEIL